MGGDKADPAKSMSAFENQAEAFEQEETEGGISGY
jgi:hypothetical protein